MKTVSCIISFLFLVGNITSQEVYPSNTFLQTCYNNETCFANQNSSNLFYNETNHEFYLVIDFTKFKTGVDSLDAWLDDLDDTKFVFKGVLNADKLPALSNHGYKTLHINGSISLNNVIQSYSLDLILFKISPEGMLYRNTGNDYYDKIRANIQLAFKPKEFKLDKKPHHLKKTISINIGSGYINQLKPGMENLIGN
ncbi:MAG: hypothetical protein JNM51_05985 [Bacteroidia bacterium]|nr:hypothetical protein [Bacteroidia bacterium]